MTDPSTSAPEWAEHLEQVRSYVAEWHNRLAEPRPAEPLSALRGDDHIHVKEPVKNASWQGLIAATDHLGLMVESLSGDGARPIAHFTLARASLFAASRTVWILHPSLRRTRQERALWVAYEDMRNVTTHVTASANDLSDPLAAQTHVQSQMDELKLVALNKLGLTLNKNGKTTDTNIVIDAAAYLDPDDGDLRRAIMKAWRVHSGHAHGLNWPDLLKPPASTFIGPDGRTYQRQGTDHAAIGRAVAAAAAMTKQAFILYEERATSYLKL
ncbi:hypothetical protein ACWFPY_32955 [Nocardia fluminea]